MTSDDAFKLISHAFASGRLSHAYLIVGAVRGMGMELAMRILQMLYCKALEKPCGTCDNCTLVAMRGHVDVHWILPEKKSRIISAEQMRESLIDEINKTSYVGGWKAGVIIGADRLNDSSANIFLKTLEEPPSNTLFLLLSEAPQLLLPTITSRCQRIDLNSAQELEEPWKSSVLAALATPCLRTPLERIAASRTLHNILADINENAKKIVELEDKQEDGQELGEEDKESYEARVSARYRELRIGFLIELQHWFRDLLILKAGGDTTLLHNPGYLPLLQERSTHLTLAQAIENLTVLADLIRQMERNISEEHALSCAFDMINHGVA